MVLALITVGSWLSHSSREKGPERDTVTFVSQRGKDSNTGYFLREQGHLYVTKSGVGRKV